MDIPELSMNIAQNNVSNGVSVAVLKKVMNTYEDLSNELLDAIKEMTVPVSSTVGVNIDMKI